MIWDSDENVCRAADHDEMLDVIAPHQHQLALTVERKRIDQAETRLPGSPARGNAQPMPEHESVEKIEDQQRGDSRHYNQPRPMKVRRPEIG